MKSLVEHRIKASPAQIKKLMQGGAITLKPENFDPTSRRMIAVMPNTARRIATAMKKGKGIRITLKPNEDLMEEGMEGGMISLKSIGKSFSSVGDSISKAIVPAAKSVGKSLKSKKAIKTYKAIGREALPIAKGIADAGIDAGSVALATYMGNPALAPVIAGTAKAGLDRGYNELGKQVGLDPNTAVPQFDSPEAAQQYALGRVESNIRSRTKGRVRDAGIAVLSGDYAKAQQLGSDYVIDKKLSGVEKKIAEKAKKGAYGDIEDLAIDYAAEKLAAATQVASGNDELQSLMEGRGIKTMVRKTRGGIRLGGASPYITSAYEQATMEGGSVYNPKSQIRAVTSISAPVGGIIQLGAPYQRLTSASMSPFLSASPQLSTKPISGGSMFPAGKYGFGFSPAG